VRGAVRPFLRRWLTAAMLLAAAVLATLYISNAIAVNDLMVSIASLERDRDVARAHNEKLRAELLKLMAVERVTSIAAGQLGMVQPIQPPQTLSPGTRAEVPAGEVSPPEAPPVRDSALVR
jgi:cell division protein FtsL